ncbi:uncharacterized protein LOC136089977 [Hydra vulgaris]|uniref:Uncharacterized protein LOC136089977 n=1 Tax=Hydra vulgaris TaxID=6087 RepID=A0ABM4DCL4_HYDVU
MEEFKILCKLKKASIAGITETWFQNSSIVQIEGYRVYNKNRSDGRKGGGVALYIENNLTSYEISIGNQDSKVEQIWAVVVIMNIKYLIGCIYRPNEQIDMNDFRQVIHNAKTKVDVKMYADILILGDFNFPNITWNNGYVENVNSSEISTEHIFIDIINDEFLIQHVNFPTFQLSDTKVKNALDLIFTKDSNRIYELQSHEILGCANKGHLVLTFKLELDINQTSRTPKYKFDYTRGDYTKIDIKVNSINWSFCFHNLTTQQMYDTFILHINYLSNLYIPKIDVNAKHKHKRNPWFSNKLRALVRMKKDLRYINLANKWKDAVQVNAYKTITKLVSKEAILARKDYERNLIIKSKSNPKLIFKCVNSQRNTKQSIKAILNSNGTVTNDQNKACGVDSLHPILLKHCAKSLALPLTLIYKSSYNTSNLPLLWRAANVTAIFKKGCKLNASNYRPVSITPIACKVFEGVIRNEMQNFFDNHNIISKCQHGFVKRRSCTTNLLMTLDFITQKLAKNIPVDVIMLDFAKAFDTLPHKRLLLKLNAYGIKGKFLNWIEAFLNNRIQRVVQGEAVSTWKKVSSGVPQGSILGPFLFITYINDLPEKIKNMVKIYADDTKILSAVYSIEDAKLVQRDLNIIEDWSEKWLIKLNESKCVVMQYGKNNINFNYIVNGSKINNSTHERDLGVNFDTSLKWKKHIVACSSKANAIMGMIKNTFVHLNQHLLKQLYTTFVRPLIEFAAPVWSPNCKGDIEILKRVQHRVTRMIKNLRSLLYEDRLQILGLTTLSERRKRVDLIQIFKIFNEIKAVDLLNKPVFSKSCRGHSRKYSREQTKLSKAVKVSF